MNISRLSNSLAIRRFTPFFMLIVTSTAVSFSSHAKVGNTHSVTIYTDTAVKNPATNSFVQARQTNLSLDDLRDLALVTKDGVNIVRLDETKKVEVTIFLPQEMDEADETAFVSEIENRLNERFANAAYAVKRAYLPAPAGDSVESEQERKQFNQWVVRTKLVARAIREGVHRPESVDLTMGSIIGAGLAVGSVYYWIADAGLNIFGYTGGATLLAFQLLNNAFSTQINKFKTYHEIPFGKDIAAIEYYNSHPPLKAAAFNEFINAFITAGLRGLSHAKAVRALKEVQKDPAAWAKLLSNPKEMEKYKVEGVFTKKFLREYLLFRLAVGPVSGGSDSGIIAFERKGYLTPRQARLAFSAINALSTANSLLYSSGGKAMKYFWPGLALEVAIRGTAWVAGKRAPAKQNRLVVLHPNLSDENRDQIEYVNELRGLVLNGETVPGSSLHELLEKDGLTMDSVSEPDGDMVMSVKAP